MNLVTYSLMFCKREAFLNLIAKFINNENIFSYRSQ